METEKEPYGAHEQIVDEEGVVGSRGDEQLVAGGELCVRTGGKGYVGGGRGVMGGEEEREEIGSEGGRDAPLGGVEIGERGGV